MFILIPTGLLRGAARAMEAADAEDRAMWLRAAAGRRSARALEDACNGPNACFVVLGHNDWNDCRIDGVPVPAKAVAAAAEGTGALDSVGPAPHGIGAICAGRHIVVSSAGGRRVRRDFLLFPAEACLLRLDGAAGWVDCTEGERQALVASAERLALVSYMEQVVPIRLKHGRVKTEEEGIAECLQWLDKLRSAVRDRHDRGVTSSVDGASMAITGVPLSSFAPLTTPIGFHAFELAGANRLDDARRFVEAGLGVLPQSPTLLAVLGEMQLRAGEREPGLANLDKALAREAGLDPVLVQRVHDLRASA